jgi:hypothetical protein
MASHTAADQALADSDFLATLDGVTRARLAPKLQRVSLELKQPLYESGRPIEHVYFPINSVISMLAEMAPQSVVEVATIGREGIVGLPLFLGADVTPGVSFAQIPGQAYRMTAMPPQRRSATRCSDSSRYQGSCTANRQQADARTRCPEATATANAELVLRLADLQIWTYHARRGLRERTSAAAGTSLTGSFGAAGSTGRSPGCWKAGTFA